MEKNITRYKNMPLEKQALQLIKEAYDGVFPSSYQVSVATSPFLSVRIWILSSSRLSKWRASACRLKSFKATSRLTTDMELNEKTFLAAAIGNPILAVAIEQHTLKPKQSTRVFVVERKEVPSGIMTTMETGAQR